ncbi:hypothetical protein GQ600_11053 [Phytophthora cactorum]|nr:hypothetical protein GQ600_11053 [Phytophthora cactorum]
MGLCSTEGSGGGGAAAYGQSKAEAEVIVQPLHTSSAKLKAAAPKEEAAKDNADTGSTTHQLDVRSRSDWPNRSLSALFVSTSTWMAFAFRIRSSSTPTQIAQDEKMSDKLKDAIAESIRRQILTFTSSCMTIDYKSDSYTLST